MIISQMSSSSEDKFPKKTYCYKSDCEYVKTGFHLERYFVCIVCKQEISESLRKQIESRGGSKEAIITTHHTDEELEALYKQIWGIP